MIVSTQLFAQTKPFAINGKKSEIEVKMFNDMNYVQLRTISQELGYEIEYNSTAKIVTVANGSKILTLNLLNGEAKLVKGSVYVPLARIGTYFGNSVEEKLENGSRVIYVTNSNTNKVNKNTIDSNEMKKVGVNFMTIGEEKVASLWNSAIYYTLGSETIRTKYMTNGNGTPVKLNGKVEMINGVTVFPRDVMDYLYIEEENVDTALEVFGFKYEDIKEYWKKGSNASSTTANNSTGNRNGIRQELYDIGFRMTSDGVMINTDGKVEKYEEFYKTAQSVAKLKLKNKSSARFDVDNTPSVTLGENGKDIWIMGELSATNSYGAYIDSSYTVLLHDGDWQKYTLWYGTDIVASNQIR